MKTFLYLFLIAATSQAFALEVSVKQNSNYQEVSFSGVIDFDETNGVPPGFTQILPGKDISLKLNSPGGNVLAAKRFTDQLNQACSRSEKCKITAVVVDQCSSACVLLFFNADERVVSKSAKIGIHGILNLKKHPMTDKVVDMATQNSARTFIELVMWGLPPDLIKTVGLNAFSSSGVTYLEPDMLVKNNHAKWQ